MNELANVERNNRGVDGREPLRGAHGKHECAGGCVLHFPRARISVTDVNAKAFSYVIRIFASSSGRPTDAKLKMERPSEEPAARRLRRRSSLPTFVVEAKREGRSPMKNKSPI